MSEGVNEGVLGAAFEHAEIALTDGARESCGLVVAGAYIRCTNIATEPDAFVIPASEWAAAEDLGEIEYIVHSHPNGTPEPSPYDLVHIERHGIPWLIVSVPGRHYQVVYPSGHRAPLTGRSWRWGTFDCYSLVRDYYQDVLGITLPDYERGDYAAWQLDTDRIERHFAEIGFERVADLRQHDVIIMQIRRGMPNHMGVLVRDGWMLHQSYAQLSCQEPYDGVWRKHTRYFLRYRGDALSPALGRG